jgi:quercetin dioxygenase-like cupin family protein
VAREPIQVGPLSMRFLVEAADSGGSQTVFEVTVPPGARVPAPHFHDAFDETIYGLEGATVWKVVDETVEVGPGDALCIQRGSVHGFENSGDEEARFLAISSPGLMSPDYFLELSDVFARASGGPPNRDAIGEVMRRHGLTPAP